ncbi:MAG TPA: hypothetical protein HA230_02080 [Candidatus Aenigmarchaeota archaeon]|nr:hypothetical protein [Candidatus Aenigmarchaeota archaeon]
MGHLDNHHHTYETVRPFLDHYQMAKLIRRIDGSAMFQHTDWSHICLKGTNTCVGYLGDESAELVDPNRRPELRLPQNKLRRYFNSA